MPGPRVEAEFTQAKIARVRDYWLGGHDSFAPDREMAARIEAAYPPPRSGEDPEPVPRRMTRCAQGFLARAVEYAAKQGVTQFLHLAAGYPPPRRACAMTHELAPGARVAYIDGDRCAVSHTLAAVAGSEGVSVLEADFTEPGDVLGLLWSDALESRERIDLRQPVAVLVPMCLQFMTARRAREVCAAYVGAMAPGSFLVVSVPRVTATADDPLLWERIRVAYAGDVFNHAKAEVTSFFEGTSLVDPGVVPVHGWNGGWGSCLQPDSVAYVVGGVGHKP